MRDELRVQLLKLVYNHGRSAEQAIDRAKVLEKFVTEAEDKKLKSGKPVVSGPALTGGKSLLPPVGK